jgi:hypothetical protein
VEYFDATVVVGVGMGSSRWCVLRGEETTLGLIRDLSTLTIIADEE